MRTALALVWILALCLPAGAQQTRTKLLLDTDIGTDIDDAWALGYALNSPSFCTPGSANSVSIPCSFSNSTSACAPVILDIAFSSV